MRSVRRVFVAVALSVALTAPAAAQSEAFIVSGTIPFCAGNCGGTILHIAPDAPALLSSVVDPAAAGAKSPYVTPDGSLLIWFTPVSGARPARIAVRDLVGRQTTTLDVPGALGIAGNPVRPEVYVFDVTGVSAFGPGGVRRFGGPVCTSTYPLSISGDGSRVLFYCQGDSQGVQPNQAVMVDTLSGQLVTSLPPWFSAALTRDGTAAYVQVPVNQVDHLQKIDIATLNVLADAVMPQPPPGFGSTGGWLRVDYRLNRVLLVGRFIHAFDGDSLTHLGTGGLSLTGQAVAAVQSALDDVDGRLYVTGTAISFGIPSYSFEVFDSNTLARVIAAPAGGFGEFVPVPKPLAPTGMTATVNGGSVAFAWTPAAAPPTTTRFVIEAGSAPGRADIVAALDVGLQTSLSASGVPPGTYYVRVRAGNYAGLSAPSNEVAVVVP